MTQVVIPAIRDGAGALVPASVTVRLVGADEQGRIAFVATDLATEYQDVTLPLAGLTLELQPQSLLALPSAAESWYRVDLRTLHRRESYLIQVPESGVPLSLRDLVGAAEIPPGSLPADIVADVLEAAAEAEDSANTATLQAGIATDAAAAVLADADRAVESLIATSALLIETQESILGIVDAEDTAVAAAATATAQAGFAAESANSAEADAGTASTQAGLASDSANTASFQAGIATGAALTATSQAGFATDAAVSAAADALTASGQASIATAQAGEATSQAGTATLQAGLASDSADLAHAWATQTDPEVLPGQGYGALKYAQDAASSAAVYTSVQESLTAIASDLIATQAIVVSHHAFA